MVHKEKNSIRIWLKEDGDKIVRQSAGEQDTAADTRAVEKTGLNREPEEWEVLEELKDEVAEKMWEIEHGESEAERLKDLEELPGYGSDEQERE